MIFMEIFLHIYMIIFLFDSAITNPIDVARRDRMEFFVESILDHRGNLSRMKEIEFLVRWLNFNDSHDSWEPYANLRDNQRLHVYLLEKNLQRLIPKKFRWISPPALHQLSTN